MIDDRNLPVGEDQPESPDLVAALREYQTALATGRRPDRGLFLARYPAVADELADCIDGGAAGREAENGPIGDGHQGIGSRIRRGFEPLAPLALAGDDAELVEHGLGIGGQLATARRGGRGLVRRREGRRQREEREGARAKPGTRANAKRSMHGVTA